MANVATDPEEILLRQTLLGAFKARDASGRNLLHASDFQAALEQLGMAFGTPIIDRVMISCRIDDNGFVDFAQFARQVDAEAVRAAPATPPTAPAPFREHGEPIENYAAQHMEEGNRQAEIIQIRKDDIRALYNEWDSGAGAGSLTKQQMLQRLWALGLQETAEVQRLMRQDESAITFAKLVRALALQNPVNSHAGPAAGERGVANGNRADNDAQLFGSRKRTNTARPQTQSNPITWSGRQEVTHRKGKAIGFDQDRAFHASNSVHNSLRPEGNVMLRQSVNRAATAAGIGLQSEFAMTSETRLLRQQIFANIRKMDSGELSAREFRNQLLGMGIEIPREVQRLLQQHESTGNANFTMFVKAFEQYFAQKNQEINVDLSSEQLAEIKTRLKETLRQRGASGIQGLGRVFRIMDDDRSGALSFGEFHKAMEEYALGLSVGECQALFNDMDTDGGGSISYEEFITGIRGQLNNARRALVHRAFDKLDATGDGQVTIDDVVGVYNARAHPDVRAGKKSENQVLQEFIDTFEGGGGEKDGIITREEFEKYYSGISASIDQDAYFDHMIRKAWNLDNTPAPPPAWRSRPDAPVARQTHGNILTWENGTSQLEAQQAAAERGRHAQSFERKNALYKNSQQDLLAWGGAQPPPAPAEARPLREGRARLNKSTTNVLDWSGAAGASAEPAPRKQTFAHQQSSQEAGLGPARRRVGPRSTRSPFGTDADTRRRQQGGPSPVRSTRNDQTSGWFAHQ